MQGVQGKRPSLASAPAWRSVWSPRASPCGGTANVLHVPGSRQSVAGMGCRILTCRHVAGGDRVMVGGFGVPVGHRADGYRLRAVPAL